MSTNIHSGRTEGDRRRGRAAGILFFLVFGFTWMYMGLSDTHHNTLLPLALLWFAAGALLVGAVLLYRNAKGMPEGDPESEEVVRAQRMFSAVNIIQWVSIGTAASIFALLHMPEYIAPAIAIIVGLHLFPLAGAFRYPPHYLTGLLLILWSLGALASTPRPQVAGVASLGTGVILLASAAYSLATAWNGAPIERGVGIESARRA